jgi:Right handed beta helix region
MKMRVTSRIAFAAFASLVLGVTSAQAQASRTWVSGVGDDVNPCSRTAPCKTFAGAISKTAAGGEINAIDPGGFGAVTITKSITIDGAGTMAGILASSTNGVVINGANIVVTLRNLSINGGPPTLPGLIGVKILNAKDVSIENCQIFNFLALSPNGRGISDQRSVAGRLTVTDTVVRNNGHTGIVVQPTVTGSSVILNRVSVQGNAAGGFAISGGTKAIVNHSVASGNVAAGFYADGAGGVSTMNLAHSVATNNGTGVNALSGAAILIGDVTIGQNTTGVSATTGSIFTYGDNLIDGNGTNGTTTGPATKQ